MAQKTSTSIRFSEEEDALLEKLRKEMNAKTKSAAVRRSVAQSSLLQKHADEDGYITLRTEDGEFIKFPIQI